MITCFVDERMVKNKKTRSALFSTSQIMINSPIPPVVSYASLFLIMRGKKKRSHNLVLTQTEPILIINPFYHISSCDRPGSSN